MEQKSQLLNKTLAVSIVPVHNGQRLASFTLNLRNINTTHQTNLHKGSKLERFLARLFAKSFPYVSFLCTQSHPQHRRAHPRPPHKAAVKFNNEELFRKKVKGIRHATGLSSFLYCFQIANNKPFSVCGQQHSHIQHRHTLFQSRT